MSHRSKVRLRAAAVLAVLATYLVAFSLPSAGGAAPPGCAARTNTTYQTLLECVTLEGVRAHQAAFQEIADDNDDPFYPGTRAAGTEGYSESVDYVAGLLEDAGYEVTLDEFQFSFDFPVTIDQLTPVAASYPSGAFTGSGFGEVTAAVVPVDINLAPPRANDSGCSTNNGDLTMPENDFVGFPAGAIALIQRGTCTFAEKAQNAQNAGASAVIIFNQGDTPTREGLIVGTLAPFQATIPVVGASFANGVALSQPGSTAHIVVVAPETRTDVNVIAEMPGNNTNNVVMAGAHLDSVTEGPGINDNGSGSAALLETALMMAKVKPENSLRFAWWGAEELGLVGSTAYVAGLSQAERDRIALYLNYDMVGSPNYVFFVYDGDNSDGVGAPAGPPGSAAIEKVYEAYYTARGIPFKGTDFSGRSDYGPFIAAGVDIPAGGLFTGAEGIKTAQEAITWGGTAGQQYDPCYHLACDTFANNSNHALEVNSDLIAYAQLTFAFSTQSVNGVPGRPVPGSG
jgi:Zn-dependent M28 family amino/carboxypeptidase